MASFTIQTLLIIACMIASAHALQCKAGYPTLGKLTAPNLPNTNCVGPWYEDICYVMFTDYDMDQYDAWTYGCIFKGSLNKCNKSFGTHGVVNNYCCCKTPLCNDMEFARNCHRSEKRK